MVDVITFSSPKNSPIEFKIGKSPKCVLESRDIDSLMRVAGQEKKRYRRVSCMNFSDNDVIMNCEMACGMWLLRWSCGIIHYLCMMVEA